MGHRSFIPNDDLKQGMTTARALSPVMLNTFLASGCSGALKWQWKVRPPVSSVEAIKLLATLSINCLWMHTAAKSKL